MYRFLAILILAGLALAPLRAEPLGPDQLVKRTTEQVLNLLEGQREALKQSPERLYDLIQGELLPHFDFELIARWVLGKYWRQASEAQQARFTREFRNLLVRTYGTALLAYTGQEIEYRPLRLPDDARDAVVQTVVRDRNGPSIPIDYRLRRQRSGEWKVYDVAIENVSLVSTYRSSYAAEIARDGMESFLDGLSRRNAEAARPRAPAPGENA